MPRLRHGFIGTPRFLFAPGGVCHERRWRKGGEGKKMKMVFNRVIHRIHGTMVSLVLLFCVAGSAVAAEPGILVEARQRYPWNGLVDLHFTITGTSDTRYDTSFTAKDMVGITNIAMRTIRESTGAAENGRV